MHVQSSIFFIYRCYFARLGYTCVRKKQVIDANKNIFDSVESISVTLNNLYLDELVAICLIEIITNNEETLKVIDIIKFNDENKIIEVSAYKQ